MDPARPALHINRLDVSQVHEDAPDWGASRRVDYDMRTGEVLQTVVKSERLKGSWESSLMVRSSGGRVSVEGNPSKWGRLEAVGAGCRSVAEAISLYNSVLQACELLLFSHREPLIVRSLDGGRERTERRGPRLYWVHIAADLRLGSAEAVGPFLDWPAIHRVGKRGLPLKSVGPLSFRAGTRRRRQLALYGKAHEVREELGRWRRKRSVPDLEAALAYLEALARRLEDGGWVRREVRLAGDYLVTKGLQWAEEWSEETMWQEWRDYWVGTGEIGGVGVMSDWKTEAFDRFLVRGMGERAARARVETLLAWMSGVDVGAGPGRSIRTFRRIAADLREVLGVDIRERPNVVTLGSRVQQVARPVVARVATEADVEAL